MHSFRATGFPFGSADLISTWASFKLPMFKMDALLEAHRKNTDALATVNHAVLDGLQRMAQRQGDLFTATVNDYGRVTCDFLSGASLEEKATKQVDAIRRIHASSVSSLRELSDIAIATNVTAVEILNARVGEAFDEFRAVFAVQAAPAVIGSSTGEVLAEPATVVEEAPAEAPSNATPSTETAPTISASPKTTARKAAPATRPARRPSRRG